MSRLQEILGGRLLEKFGLRITSFSPATGWYRTAPGADVYRWEAFGVVEDPSKLDVPKKCAGQPVQLVSYDTMTECSKKKRVLQLTHHSGDLWNHYEVSACTVIKVA